MEFVVAVDDYSKSSVSKNEGKANKEPTLSSPASFPRTITPDHLRPKKSAGRRVSIDVIDTSLLANLKSAAEQEEERLEALKEINVLTNEERPSTKSNIFDHVLHLVSKVVQSNYMAVTLLGKHGEQWDVTSSGITGDEIPFEVYLDIMETDGAVTFLDAQQDPTFEDTNFGYYVGIPLRNKRKVVGVFSVVDYKPIENFTQLSIEVVEGAGKLIVEQLRMQKNEMDKQRKLLQEVEEQKRLLVLQEELRNRTKRVDRSAEASPRRGLIDLEEVYTSWIDEDTATGDQLAHLLWVENWQHEYPRPPVASNDKSRCEAAVFYRSLIEDPTRILFNEICHTICETLAVPMAIIGTVTTDNYYAEAANVEGFTTLPRETALCNYTLKKSRPFVIPDLKGSPVYGRYPAAQYLGFYAAAPLCTSDGFNIGTICVCDTVARSDFDTKKQKQLAAFSKAFMRHLEIRRLKVLNLELSLEKERLHKQLSNKKVGYPERDVTFVCTDVENSTPLWEHHSADMNIAQKLHDQLIRGCIADCFGYEIGTEGDSFELAFHSAVDAVRWCLAVQEKLIQVSWPEGLIKSDYCKEEISADGRKLFFGLRVRMAVHSSNDFEVSMQKVSQRMRYFGAGVNSVRTLSAFASGGQILISDSAFELINGSLDNLGNPFVIDLGTHSLDGPHKHCEMNVYQLLPTSLGPTYTTPTEHGEDLSRNKVIEGRTFPLIKSFKLISPSYFDAPRKGNVHMVFAVIDKHTRANLVDSTLMRPTQTSISHIFSNLLAMYNGYICHEEHGSYMLAFHTSFEASSWCIETMDALKNFNACDNKKPTVQMGIHSGKFEDCRPHPLTGRMYYFGAVVNRTARIANKAIDGQVLVSKELILDLQQTTSAEMKKKFLVQEEGSFTLKGILEPVSLCSLIKRNAASS